MVERITSRRSTLRTLPALREEALPRPRAQRMCCGVHTESSADRSEMGQIDRSRRRRGCAGALRHKICTASLDNRPLIDGFVLALFCLHQFAPFDLLATMLSPHASRPTSGIRSCRKPSPASYCLTPTAEFPMNSRGLFCIFVHFRLQPVHGPSVSRAPAQWLAKTERGPILRSGPLQISMSPNQATPAEKSIRFSPLAAAQLLNILSRTECSTPVAPSVPADGHKP